MPEGRPPQRFAAFISYRHIEPDGAVARWLHVAIESYRIPAAARRELGLPARLGAVFRDDDELAASPDLAADIRAALDASAALIVVCSPAAALSRWVDAEVRAFQDLGREDRIVAVVAAGKVPEALPPSLRGHAGQGGPLTGSEPLAVHLGTLDDRAARRSALLRVVARLAGCRYDDLRRRDAARRRRRATVVAVGAVAVVAAGAATVWSLRRAAAEETARRRGAFAAARERARQAALERDVDGATRAVAEAAAFDGGDPTLGFLAARVASLRPPGSRSLVGSGRAVSRLVARGRRVIAIDDAGCVLVFDGSGNLVRRVDGALAVDRDLARALVVERGDRQDRAFLEDVDTAVRRPLPGLADARISTAEFGDGGGFCAVCWMDRDLTSHVTTWDAATLRDLATFGAGGPGAYGAVDALDAGPWVAVEDDAPARAGELMGRVTTVRLHDARDGQLLWTFDGASSDVRIAAALPETGRVLAWGADAEARLVDPASGTLVAAWGADEIAVVEGTGGSRVATLRREHGLEIRDAVTGAVVASYPGSSFGLAACLLGGGRLLVPGAPARVVAAEDGRTLAELAGPPSGALGTPTVSPDGRWAVWPTMTPTCLYVAALDGSQSGEIRLRREFPRVEFVEGTGELAACADDGDVTLHNLGALASPPTLPIGCGDAAVLDAAYDAEGRRVVCASANGRVLVVDSATGRTVAMSGADPCAALRAVVSPTCDAAAFFDEEAVTLVRWAAEGGAVRQRAARWGCEDFRVPGDRTIRITGGLRGRGAFLRDGSAFVAVCDGWPAALVWDVGAVRVSGRPACGDACRIVKVSPARTVVFGARDGTVRVHDLSGLVGASSETPPAHELAGPRGLRCLAFSASGDRLAAGGDDGAIRVWDAAGTTVREISDGASPVTCLAFDSAAARLFAGHGDSRGTVWDLSTGEAALRVDQRDGGGRSPMHLPAADADADPDDAAFPRALTCAVFGSGDALLATGSRDATVCVWDASDGALLWVYGGASDGSVVTLEWPAAGTRILAMDTWTGASLLDVSLADEITAPGAGASRR